MQKKHFYVAVAFVVCFGAGCKKDFLERDSLTQLAEGSFWKTESDVQLGINGIYDALQDRSLYSGSLNGGAGLPMYDGLSDNTFNNWTWEGPGDFMQGRIDPANWQFSGLWVASYRGISRANLALAKIPAIPEGNFTTIKRPVFIAQAKFLRALLYLNLAVYFEDVPLILEPQTLENAFVPKNTFAQVRDAIVKDLTEAAVDLPASYPAALYGYATKGAALGLLARMHLYTKNWAGVLAATDQILPLGYNLSGSYAAQFTPAGENSRDVVFSVRFTLTQSNNGELFSGTFESAPKVDMVPLRNAVRAYHCTDGRPITTSPLYDATRENLNRDPRLTASVYFPGDIFIVNLNRAFTGNTPTRYGQRKYIRNGPSATGIGVASPGGQDFYVLRYADVLLMRAEALVELGRQAEAYPLVNLVRARVNMPTVENVEGNALSQSQMLEVVRQERRVELAFEGLRFFDLKRWGQMPAAFLRIIADNTPGYAPVDRGARSLVLPIPQSELDVNKQLEQHPAWR
ncbi:MAG: RagB/SusD family nutrient uptake outer membrane protein [Bacteroidetes bacterium]|nr:MAG: RagB/SusD family nutrient uptake outer membrane protein [Bacteroidota bacterium]